MLASLVRPSLQPREPESNPTMTWCSDELRSQSVSPGLFGMTKCRKLRNTRDRKPLWPLDRPFRQGEFSSSAGAHPPYSMQHLNQYPSSSCSSVQRRLDSLITGNTLVERVQNRIVCINKGEAAGDSRNLSRYHIYQVKRAVEHLRDTLKSDL